MASLRLIAALFFACASVHASVPEQDSVRMSAASAQELTQMAHASEPMQLQAAAKNLSMYQLAVNAFPPYGVPVTDTYEQQKMFENYMERAIRTVYNAVRISPMWFRDVWMTLFVSPSDNGSIFQVFNTSTYLSTPKKPIPWNLNLNRVARAHSFDRTTCTSSTGGSPHNDCNGTAASKRISNYFWSSTSEILIHFPIELSPVQTRKWPLYALTSWVCDGFANGALQIGKCCTDKGSEATSPLGCASLADGHRAAIMTVDGEVGCGWEIRGIVAVTTCNEYGLNSGPYATATFIYDGAHIFHPKNNSAYAFWSTFYAPDGITFISASVIIDGMPQPMSLLSGDVNRGIYSSEWFSEQSSEEECHCYYFEFVTAQNGTSRFPAEGVYFTEKVGKCVDNYYPHAAGCTTAAPTAAGVTYRPTTEPTGSPVTQPPTQAPTRSPTQRPSRVPSLAPTQRPTRVPSIAPTKIPTRVPTQRPTKAPTGEPTTRVPTQKPTKSPTNLPTTREPTQRPTKAPTLPPVAAAESVGNLTPGEAAAIIVPCVIIGVLITTYFLYRFIAPRGKPQQHMAGEEYGSELEAVDDEENMGVEDSAMEPEGLQGTEEYPDDVDVDQVVVG